MKDRRVWMAVFVCVAVALPLGFRSLDRIGSGVAWSYVITGAGQGGGPHARVFHYDPERMQLGSFFPYPPGFQGGVRVAMTAFGFSVVGVSSTSFVVTGAGPGGGPLVRAFSVARDASQTVEPEAAFFPYNENFGGGVSVATYRESFDPVRLVVTGPGQGGGPHVRVFEVADTGATSEIDGFFAYDPGFTGGVWVAAGDINGDGVAEIITGPGPGGGPNVRVFAFTNVGDQYVAVASFFAYPPSFTGGVFVAAGDVDGDGKDEIITGAGPGGGPHVRVFGMSDPDNPVALGGFFPYPAGFTGGVRVAAGDADFDEPDEIFTGAGPGGGPLVRAFDVTGGSFVPADSFFPYPQGFSGGVFVGGAETE